MNMSFESKVALVTGAGSGIGLATAKAFAEAGASVVLADNNEDTLRAAADELTSAGHKAAGVICDVADEAQVAAMVERAVATFGRLDAAFNNAGVQPPAVETADASGEEFDRVTAINLRGVWNCMKHELRQMREQGSGIIVNCSSIGGLIGLPGRATYHAAKHRRNRPDQERRSRICPQGHPHKRGVPRDHRYADGRGHVGQGAGRHEGDRERSADWAAWPAGGDRLRRSLALQSWRELPDRPRISSRRWLHRALTPVSERQIAHETDSPYLTPGSKARNEPKFSVQN